MVDVDGGGQEIKDAMEERGAEADVREVEEMVAREVEEGGRGDGDGEELDKLDKDGAGKVTMVVKGCGGLGGERSGSHGEERRRQQR